jgi:hypothetical protein
MAKSIDDVCIYGKHAIVAWLCPGAIFPVLTYTTTSEDTWYSALSRICSSRAFLGAKGFS